MNGSPEALTDSDGVVKWRQQWPAGLWGRERHEVLKDAHGVMQNLRFQGQYLDRETGLHYNLFRYYDPDCGRFTQPDPISIRGGLNLYAYVVNPLLWIDPLGLVAEPNEGNAPQHGGTGHNRNIDDEIAILKDSEGVSDIRKNQQQVDINGNKVGNNKPDIQYDKDGIHHNVEYDTSPRASKNYEKVITANDPNARSTFWNIDKDGNKIGGRSVCGSGK
ncbi:Rhs family protein [Salmonella enterica]|nr:RHS repeat-associated core domain-containing protein [Salmonella enterica]EHO5065349.1 Rhs family protein [Salmonella enterica]EHO5106511.1 Rhs family protein [Salmonella enterica]EHO5921576.1 Rhs family protein [Salmonella enterica]